MSREIKKKTNPSVPSESQKKFKINDRYYAFKDSQVLVEATK